MNAREINARLANRATEVCEYLFPAGRVYGNQFKVGDIHGGAASNTAKGGSLVIDIAGPTVGRFKDFDAAEDVHGGSFLDLWMAARTNGDFKQALHEAARWIGVDLDRKPERVNAGRTVLQKKAPPPPGDLAKRFREVEEGSDVWKWLCEERRLSAEAIREFRLGEASFTPRNSDERWTCVVFPTYDDSGTLIRVKGRDIHDKSKMYFYPKKSMGGELHLWGKHAVRSDSGRLLITEGEFDAMSAWMYGYSAVSVPNGAQRLTKMGENPNDEWLERDYEFLSRWDEVIMALDADEAGWLAVDAIAPRIGRERTRVMALPEDLKDLNGCLQDAVEGEVLEVWIEESKDYNPPDQMALPSDFRQELWEEFYPVDGEEPGDPSPWTLPFRFRPGEVTVWHGYNASGKTVCMTYCMMWLCAKLNRKVSIASLEMHPKKTLRNAMRMLMGKHRPDDEREYDAVLAWMDERIFMFNHVGEAPLKDILEVWKYAVRKYGVRYLVLDSLMRCDVQEEDYESQKMFMNKLVSFAAEYQVNVNVVCHSKKPDSRHPEKKHWPSKTDISGSHHLSNLPHNVVCIWRNRKKEQDLYELLLEPLTDDRRMREDELKQEADSLFIVQKQRETGQEEYKHLFFDTRNYGKEGSWQYFEDENAVAERLVGSIGVWEEQERGAI
jgi:twinkle protein